MTRRWTTKLRAEALESGNCEISLNHGIDAGHPNASILESALHEIAHAVVLGPRYERQRKRFDLAISNKINSMSNTRPRAWIWQEILALAVEASVLKQLKLPYHRQIVYGNNEIGSVYEDQTFCRLVDRATRTKATRRRIRRARRLLDRLCEEGMRRAK